MTAVIFLGPTLPAAEAREMLEAVCLPPARRGDVLAAVLDHAPDTIVLIDGYFEQVPSVWHKELLWALSLGLRVCGAASMGALRAAELAQFGMVGTGRVFEAYRTGRFAPFDDPFEDDDEVAVVHGPESAGYAATEALVDIRATLDAAERAGVVASAERDAIGVAAKRLFYKRRTWPAVLRAAGGHAPMTALDALAAWLPGNRVAQKRLDAALLLGQVRDGLPQAAPPAYRFGRTLIWEEALAAAAGQRAPR